MFKGRKIAIATMHQKERVISPILSCELGMESIIPNINTDAFGTFSGEVERKHSPYETARKKCEIAMETSSCDIAIASEGSFGPHPHMYFAHANDELILLVDRKNNKEYFGRELTTDTNFSCSTISSKEEAFDFAEKIGFPNHAVIIKDQEKDFKEVVKGINSIDELNYILNKMLKKHITLWIETDMRALYNPTRMNTIKRATENLISKLNSLCPDCNSPGFWITEAIKGLPCSNCGLPTKSIKTHKYECKQCLFHLNKDYPDNKYTEEPMYCDFCNP